MAISDYSSLVAAIQNTAHRQNLAPDQLIQAAQEQIENDIPTENIGNHIRAQENSYPPIAIQSGTAPLPSDWIAPKLLTVSDGNATWDLIFKSATWIYDRYPIRQPRGIPRYVARDVIPGGTGWPSTGGSLNFTATDGQATYDLSGGPQGVAVLLVALDGAVLTPGVDYVLIGTQLTLLSVPVAGQQLLVQYAASGIAPPGASNSSVLIFGPYPDDAYIVQGTYYASAPLLSSTAPTNWMVTLAPMLLHAACMVEVGKFIPDDKLIARWQQVYQEKLQALVTADKAERWASSTLAVNLGQ